MSKVDLFDNHINNRKKLTKYGYNLTSEKYYGIGKEYYKQYSKKIDYIFSINIICNCSILNQKIKILVENINLPYH